MEVGSPGLKPRVWYSTTQDTANNRLVLAERSKITMQEHYKSLKPILRKSFKRKAHERVESTRDIKFWLTYIPPSGIGPRHLSHQHEIVTKTSPFDERVLLHNDNVTKDRPKQWRSQKYKVVMSIYSCDVKYMYLYWFCIFYIIFTLVYEVFYKMLCSVDYTAYVWLRHWA